MESVLCTAAAASILVALVTIDASAGPIDLVLNPAPQQFSNTCQSYSMALAATFYPASPFTVDKPQQLRDLERKLRQALVNSAKGQQPVRKDWKAAMET